MPEASPTPRVAWTTPLARLAPLVPASDVEVYAKRDDLTPMAGGGNKVRKMASIAREAARQGADALVTTGGTQSNHARVVALWAAERGWDCHLVLHGDPVELERPTGNLRLMLLAGATLEVVAPDEIRDRLDRAVSRLESQGARPYLVPGGGHCLAGTLAYVDAVSELRDQCADWVPDWIVLASGTGATQAGIAAGCVRLGWPTHVVGISVARRNPRGRQVVGQAYAEACDALGLASGAEDIDFRDDWIGGGYGVATDRVYTTIDTVGRQTGLVLDPTYTGKAFVALQDLINSGEIQSGSRVVFWHTGGLLNLMADEDKPAGSASPPTRPAHG